MARRKTSRQKIKRQKEFLHTLLFFAVTTLSISGLLIYLWVYTEVDETLLAIEIQQSTVNELHNNIKELKSDIALLNRVDRVTSIARSELGMVFAQPETVIVYIDQDYTVGFSD